MEKRQYTIHNNWLWNYKGNMIDNLTKIQWIAHAINTLKGHAKDKMVSISETTTLRELNLDSLDIVELQMMYEDAFGVELPPGEVPASVADLLAIMR